MTTLIAVMTVLLLVTACGAGGVAQPSPTPTRPAATLPFPPTGTAPTPRLATTAAALPCAETAPATRASIELEKGGTIVIQLRPDKARCTVANFAKNARDGRYNGLAFHRVEPGFVIQGGDPEGTGRGGGSQATELNDLPFTKGAVGIARAGDIRISNLMQFYVCTGGCRHLDGQYTNFGQVISGQEIADAVKVGDRIKAIRIE